jgi:hypothetical protein
MLVGALGAGAAVLALVGAIYAFMGARPERARMCAPARELTSLHFEANVGSRRPALSPALLLLGMAATREVTCPSRSNLQ